MAALVGCRSAQDSPQITGPIVFIDAAGNRMTVDGRSGTVSMPTETPAVDDTSVFNRVQTDQFQGDSFMDSEALMLELEQREQQRFYVVPDGSGGRQTLTTADIGIGTPRSQEPKMRGAAVVWQVCRVIVPLLELKPARRYDLRFPVEDGRGVVHAGYRVTAPPDSKSVRIDSYVRSGEHAQPLLARLDEQGRVLSIVNNMPTQSIPETVFRYATVSASADLIEGAGGDYALLDAGRLDGLLPAECGLQSRQRPGFGQVTVQFSGSEE